MKLTAAQLSIVKERFGAEFAVTAIENDYDFAEAVERGSEATAAALKSTRTEFATVSAKLTDAEAKVSKLSDENRRLREGLADPLAASLPRKREEADADAKAKAEAEAKEDARLEAILAGKDPDGK